MSKNGTGAIVPMTDSELISLANKAKIEGATGWKRFKLNFLSKVRTLDLTEYEVIEAISEHLIRRPVVEAERIEASVKDDIRKTEALIKKLDIINLKINPTPTDEFVDVMVKSAMAKVRQKISDIRQGQDRAIATQLKKYANLKFPEKAGAKVSESERDKSVIESIVQHYQWNSIYSNSLADDVRKCVEDMVVRNLFSSNEEQYFLTADEESIVNIIRGNIIDLTTQIHKEMSGSLGVQHPITVELYAKHRDEIVATKKRLQELLITLEEQQKKTEEIIAPIYAMASDLRTYLTVAEDIQSIRLATAFLNIAEQRSQERGYAMAMLSHYSEMAFSALGEVKSTLDSYQNAQQELGSSGVTCLVETSDGVYAQI